MDTVNAWVQTWHAQDIDRYLAFYSNDFTFLNGQSRQAWAEQCRLLITL